MKTISMLSLTLLLSFSLNTILQGQTKTFSTFKNIPAQEFKRISETEADAVILDVRGKKEYRKGHIKNSILPESREALNRISDTLDFEQPVLVYCTEGTRSITACTILKEKGFLNVYNLESGVAGWKEAGFELTKK